MQLTDIQLDALEYALEALPDSPMGRIASDALCKIITAHNAGAQEPVAEDHECVYENGDGVCRQCVALAKQSKVFGYARRTDGYRTTGQTPEDHELCNADAPGAFALYSHPQSMTDTARGVLAERQRCIKACESVRDRSCAPEHSWAVDDCIAEIERLDRAKGK